MKKIFEWFKAFFAVDNTVNENTVMGVLFTVVLIVGVFIGLAQESIWVLAGMVLTFFGLGALKK